MTRIGLLGGTFDPPHVAHVAMADAAREHLGLDRVLFVPAMSPPHKSPDSLSSYDHRLRMTEIAAQAIGAEVSRAEEKRDGPSFTVDLLREFRAQGDVDLYFIMGADSLRDLPLWREAEAILDLCTLVIFPRDDIPVVSTVGERASLVIFEEPKIEVASHEIREILGRGESARGLVPQAVLDYIEETGLYRT